MFYVSHIRTHIHSRVAHTCRICVHATHADRHSTSTKAYIDCYSSPTGTILEHWMFYRAKRIIACAAAGMHSKSKWFSIVGFISLTQFSLRMLVVRSRGKRCNWFNEWMKNMRFKGCYDVVLWLQVSSFRSVFNLKMIGSKTNKYWIYTKTQAYSFHTFIFLFIIISTRRPYIYTLFLQYDLLLCCFFFCVCLNIIFCFVLLH